MAFKKWEFMSWVFGRKKSVRLERKFKGLKFKVQIKSKKPTENAAAKVLLSGLSGAKILFGVLCV